MYVVVMYVLSKSIEETDDPATVVVISFVWVPASPKVKVPTPVVPDPDTESTFKTFPAVIFPDGNFIVYDWLAECGEIVILFHVN